MVPNAADEQEFFDALDHLLPPDVGVVKVHPEIDLTDAARAYGMHKVPKVEWNMDRVFSLDTAQPTTAGLDPFMCVVRAGSRLCDRAWMVSEPNQLRFTRAGAPRLGYEDAVRFVFAHELWHAAQAESGDLTGSAFRSDHDQMPTEIDADRHAAQVYKLVKINGR